MNDAKNSRWRGAISLLLTALFVFSSTLLIAQPKYRTFNQDDLALKKASKFAKRIATLSTFTFHNDSDYAVTSLHSKFESEIIEVTDSGGFTTFSFDKKHLDASGRVVAAHDSAILTILFHKKDNKNRAKDWWWDTNSVQIGQRYKHLEPDTSIPVYGQPNGGTVRDYIYKRLINHHEGIYVGIETDDPGVGWIQYKKSDRKYFPHTDSSRCFDYIKEGEGGSRVFNRQLKNPHVKKHNNHLLGELHALKLAIIASDSGLTEPFDASTRLGDLVYNDASNPGDPSNGMTLREVATHTDSGLTYCSHYPPTFYFEQDSAISRINRAFDGPYVAITFHPFTLAGTNTVPAFLHPSAVPAIPHFQHYSPVDDLPGGYALSQNYPNPFNPVTTIDFNLADESMVTLKVYNLLGQEVTTLLNGEQLEEGDQTVEFDASWLPSGVYFYKLNAISLNNYRNQFQSTKRMMLLK